jgi:uncharacterized damage-inducible protein DinB
MSTSISEASILADVYEDVRGLTKFYIAKSKRLDPHQRYEVNGQLLNSRYWLLAHLVWSEHMLIVKGIGDRSIDIPWLEKFSFGTEPPDHEGLPTMEEVLEKMDEVHKVAMECLRGLSEEELSQPNHHPELSFRGDNTKRMIIHHAIRHEPCHTGQLGWLCKIGGVETF